MTDVVAMLAKIKTARQEKELNTLTSLKAQLCPSGCEMFEDKAIGRAKRELIEQANGIIEEFAAKGFKLTLRQLFYQFVARDLLANKQKEYKRLGDAIGDGRNHGMIRWDRIEDRTRYLREHPSWDDPAHRIRELHYQEDLWAGQPWRPEVWIEKDALVGIIEGVCNEFRVPYFSCRGYSSEPLQYEAAKRFEEFLEAGLTPIVLYLGDHDPSGLQMTRDIEYKLWKFSRGKSIEVRRLALNEDQIDKFNPPPNLVKDSDSRSAVYKWDYGGDCWELDALDPTVVGRLIRDELDGMISHEAWGEALAREEENHKLLRDVAERWPDVVNLVRKP